MNYGSLRDIDILSTRNVARAVMAFTLLMMIVAALIGAWAAQAEPATPAGPTAPATPSSPPAPSTPAIPPGSEVYTQAEIQALLNAQAAQATKACENAQMQADAAVANASGALAKLRKQLAPPPTP
jgi:hypothetical protein